MQRGNRLILAKIAVLTAAIPFLLYGYFYGPDPGYTGAPSDNGGATCATSGCHSGTANQFSTGSVRVNFPNGLTYTPGVAQQLSVTIADSATTQKSWGFQLTPRVASSPGTMAGTLAAASDGSTQIMYSETNLQIFCAPGTSTGQTPSCPGVSNSTLYPLQFVEHSYTGYMKSVGTTGSFTYNFTWTPPATNVRNITIYVAGNAGTGTLVQASVPPTGDHIYSNSYTLTPASGGGTGPSIAGVAPADSPVSIIQPGSWVSLYGSNLASATATWTGNFPTTLGGVSVSIDGKPAYLSYVSPTQINLQAPSDTATGPVPVVVTSGSATATSTVTLAQYGPSFLLLDSKHVAGLILRSDGSGAYGGGSYDIIGPTGSSLGFPAVAAKAGDVIELFGTGFGPTSPAVPAGQAFSGAAPTTGPVTLLINNMSVPTPNILFAGLSGPGLDQINLIVPPGLGTGDVPLQAMVGGVQTPSSVVISLQ